LRHARAGWLLPLLLANSLACRRATSEARLSAEEQNLARRIRGLEALAKDADQHGGRLIRFDDVLVVVRQKLIQEVLDSGLPLERDVAGRFHVRLQAAHVLLEDGFAPVQLSGEASLKGQGEVRAEISVYGGLDVVDLDPASGILTGRVRIYAVEARTTAVLGVSVPARRLVEQLSREKLEAFATLLSSIAIPVRLGSEVTLPAIGPQGGVRIEAQRIPLAAVIADVKSFRHRLWISVAVRAGARR
jgi:hypothetical protein